MIMLAGGLCVGFGLTELILGLLSLGEPGSVAHTVRRRYLQRSPFFLAIGVALLIFWATRPQA